MAFSPISGATIQYSTSTNILASGYYLKFYVAGTTTSFNMAINSAGGGLLDKSLLDSSGIPTTDGTTRFIPYVNQKYKIVLYKNAIDADADTTGNAEWVIDNIEQFQSSGTDAWVLFPGAPTQTSTTTFTLVGDQTATFTPGTRVKFTDIGTPKGIVLTSAFTTVTTVTVKLDSLTLSGSLTAVFTSIATTTEREISAHSIVINQIQTGTINRGLLAWLFDVVNVKDHGALGDATTDDLQAFDDAVAVAAANGKRVYIPAVPNFYKLSDTWEITSRPALSVFGDGPRSYLVSYNEAGKEIINVKASIRVDMKGFAMGGITGGGSALVIDEITSPQTPSHYGRYSDILIQRIEGYCIDVVSGQSTVFTDVRMDRGLAERIITLTGGKTEPVRRDGGVYVRGHLQGHSNNQSFVNCVINSVSGETGAENGIKVGDATAVPGTFNWTGGLIQGGPTSLVSMKCLDGHIQNVHIEAIDSATIHTVTFDTADNCSIKNAIIDGDIRFINGCSKSGLENVRTDGVLFEQSSKDCYIRDSGVLNDGGGPVGAFRDLSPSTEVRRVEGGANASATRYAVGDSTGGGMVPWFSTNFTHWYGGGTPTFPCGMVAFDNGAFGGVTTTKDTAIVRNGDSSLKVVTTTGSGSDYDQGYRVRLEPIQPDSKYLMIAWVYVASGKASLRLSFDAGATSDYPVTTTGQWVRVQMTLKPEAGDTFYNVQLANGKASTVHWGSFEIKSESNPPFLQLTLENIASPELGPINGVGYHVPTYLATGATAITDFSGGWVGQRFTLIFDGVKTVTNNANIKLAGAANFVSTALDTLTLVLDETDGVFKEVSRSVN